MYSYYIPTTHNDHEQIIRIECYKYFWSFETICIDRRYVIDFDFDFDIFYSRAFKSFKLKKKSSTLGINKTSESPPELRRVYPLTDTYNTVDSRSRHTYDIGLGNNFHRTGYRSSLQNVHTTGGVSVELFFLFTI